MCWEGDVWWEREWLTPARPDLRRVALLQLLVEVVPDGVIFGVAATGQALCVAPVLHEVMHTHPVRIAILLINQPTLCAVGGCSAVWNHTDTDDDDDDGDDDDNDGKEKDYNSCDENVFQPTYVNLLNHCNKRL